jgi:hypothetical protein
MAAAYLNARNTTNALVGRRQRVQVLFGMPASDAPI